ncbi:MAG: hypothetical protein R3D66_04030 [Alphaproteobacteria bacterium]
MELIVIIVIGIAAYKFGWFTKLISLYKKSDAATSVQNLLEHQAKYGVFEGDPASTATEYVQAAWDDKPHVFDGRFGKRPHKLSIVVYALALAVCELHNRSDDQLAPVLIALTNAMSEVEANGAYYPLTSVDRTIMEEALALSLPAIKAQTMDAEDILG